MIHLIYPHRDRISAPDVIGRKLLQHLGSRHSVEVHNFDSMGRIDPAPGDVLIGHAHPLPCTIFRRSVRRPGWARRILLEPFNADWRQVGFIDKVIDDCDQFLAITGRYWFENPSPATRRWLPKMVHLDLAIDRAQYPTMRTAASPPGSRRVVYIGNDHPGKNLAYLDAIAGSWRNGTIDWIGPGAGRLRHVRSLGRVDFSEPGGRELVSSYDFMLTVGSADANPTTVLEAMSWGLIPICTPTSGYIDDPAIVNVPPNDVDAVVRVLDHLQHAPAEDLADLRMAANARLTDHFNWPRFVGEVEAAIGGTVSPPIARRSAGVPPFLPRPRLVAGFIANNLRVLKARMAAGFK